MPPLAYLEEPPDFVEGGKLITNITVNGVTDKTPYPKTVSHVMLAFGVPSITDNIESVVEDYTSQIKALLKKYPKKPIFVCEECHLTVILVISFPPSTKSLGAALSSPLKVTS